MSDVTATLSHLLFASGDEIEEVLEATASGDSFLRRLESLVEVTTSSIGLPMAAQIALAQARSRYWHYYLACLK